MAFSPVIIPTVADGFAIRQTGLGTDSYDLTEAFPPDTGIWQSKVLDLGSPKFQPNSAYAFDRSRYNNHGAITGATWTRLPSGKWALSFDGADDLITVTDAASIQNIYDGVGGSALALIYPRTLGELSAGKIFHKGTSADNKGWSFRPRSVTQLRFNHYFDGGADGAWRTNDGAIGFNAWNLVCVTYDSDLVTNDPIFYVGVGGAVSTPAVVEDTTPIGTRISDVGANLIIGNRDDAALTFDGYIALAQLLKGKMLTLAEFTSFYNQTRHLLGV